MNTPTKIVNAVENLQIHEDEDGDEDAAVLRLPELAMHRVLSYLEPGELTDAAAACRQWHDLARSRPLWREKQLVCDSVDRLRDAVHVAPPWDSLAIAVTGGRGVRAHFKQDARLLSVRAPSAAVAAALLAARELGQQATHLRLREHPNEALDAQQQQQLGQALWAGLRGARRLQTLRLRLRAAGPLAESDFRWPQNAASRLQHLEKVQLEMLDEKPTAGDAPRPSAALEWLLRAHRTQLVSVGLMSASLAPLLDACPDGLRVLTVAAVPGVAAKLQRFADLEELRFEGMQSAALLEVTRLLRAPGPLAGLRSLALRSAAACGDAVEALADGQLPQLRHLQLAVPAASVRAVGAVGRALAGLRRLHSLTLRPAPAAEALDGIAAADMPALRLIVVLGSCLPSAAECRQRFLALIRLVRRAPQPLHILCAECRCGQSSTATSTASSLARRRPQTLLLAGHPFSPCPESCSVCVEARQVHASGAPLDETAVPPRYVRVKA